MGAVSLSISVSVCTARRFVADYHSRSIHPGRTPSNHIHTQEGSPFPRIHVTRQHRHHHCHYDHEDGVGGRSDAQGGSRRVRQGGYGECQSDGSRRVDGPDGRQAETLATSSSGAFVWRRRGYDGGSGDRGDMSVEGVSLGEIWEGIQEMDVQHLPACIARPCDDYHTCCEFVMTYTLFPKTTSLHEVQQLFQ